MYWSFYFNTLEKIGGRYFMLAGLAFLIYYILLRKRISFKKIQAKYPRIKDYAREISFSFLTICIFACVPLLILGNPSIEPHTTHYKQIETYGWVYFFLAFPLMLIIHDTIFIGPIAWCITKNYSGYFTWCIMNRLIHLHGLLIVFTLWKPS